MYTLKIKEIDGRISAADQVDDFDGVKNFIASLDFRLDIEVLSSGNGYRPIGAYTGDGIKYFGAIRQDLDDGEIVVLKFENDPRVLEIKKCN